MFDRTRRYSVGASTGFNPYGAGEKRYGASGRSMPTVGPVDKSGYKERDARIRARRNALLQQMQATQAGQFMNPAALRQRVRKVF